MKKLLKTLSIIIAVVVLSLGGFIVWLTAAEYRPKDVEPAEQLSADAKEALQPGATLELVSWNIGYAGLGANSDFFLDGGRSARAADEPTVRSYLDGIDALLNAEDCDLVLLQEVDRASHRSYNIDEAAALVQGDASFALNYSCPFVPIPIPPIGKVSSGLLTLSNYEVANSERVSLPCPFSWPFRLANLKRCLLVSYLPISDSGRQLVLVNLHLEAYDDGAGKIAQTNRLMQLLESEYEKGNYVIAGGDFNQAFPGSLEVYPNAHPELWKPGVLEETMLPEGWQFAYSAEGPTCRLLNQPYDPEDVANTQYYVIDGFILSPNVKLNAVNNLAGEDFANSDHNPVRLSVTLME